MKSATMKNGKEGEKMKMFTKEKLEKWIRALNIIDENNVKKLKKISTIPLLFEGDSPTHNRINELEDLIDLKHTLEQIYTSMTSDNSI